MAGEFLMNEAKKHKALIIPIDSEHCSVHQSIQNIDKKDISKITITCSGGPFYLFQKINLKIFL